MFGNRIDKVNPFVVRHAMSTTESWAGKAGSAVGSVRVGEGRTLGPGRPSLYIVRKPQDLIFCDATQPLTKRGSLAGNNRSPSVETRLTVQWRGTLCCPVSSLRSSLPSCISVNGSSSQFDPFVPPTMTFLPRNAHHSIFPLRSDNKRESWNCAKACRALRQGDTVKK